MMPIRPLFQCFSSSNSVVRSDVPKKAETFLPVVKKISIKIRCACFTEEKKFDDGSQSSI